jgi:hypothetical protein
MLEVLSWIEMQANRPVAALKVLFECRSLRSRGSPKALDDTLLISRLLMTTGEWSAAYAELANLLGRADAAGWDGLLTALDLCVEAEEKCSAKMQATLSSMFAAAVRSYGLPIGLPLKGVDCKDAIRGAHKMFSEALRVQSDLLLQGLTATTPARLEEVVRQLEDQIANETVEFFRRGQQNVLDQLTGRRAYMAKGKE